MSRKKALLFLSFSLVIILLLSGCGKNTPAESPSVADAAPTSAESTTENPPVSEGPSSGPEDAPVSEVPPVEEPEETAGPDLAPLEETLVSMVETFPGVWSVYVEDVESGASLSIHDEPMVAASLIKLYVAGAYYDYVEKGLLENDLRDSIRIMINRSDNDACNKLIDLIGKDPINAFIKEEGYQNTLLNRKMLEPSPLENYTSAKECGDVLRRILKEEYITPDASDDLLQALKEQERTWKIPAGLPEGIESANKTGELLDVENDVAIVWGPESTYLLCIMVNNLENTKQAQENISLLSETVYTYLNPTD